MTRCRLGPWTALALAVAIGPVALAQGTGDDRSPDPLGPHRVAGTPGEVVPRFALPDLDGSEHTLEQQLRRGRAVALEWIAPRSDAWRGLHGQPGGALRRARERHRDQVAWLAICTFAVPVDDPGEPSPTTTAPDRPLDAPGRSGQQVQQQSSFWGGADGQRPSWDRERTGGATATWPWFEQPPAVPFAGPTAALTREEALSQCREAGQVLGPDVPVLLDAGGSVAARLGVTTAPHVVVVDPDGRLVYAGPPLAADGTEPVDAALMTLRARGGARTTPGRR